MIGALLSNTPANLLRSNGVAGEVEPGTGTNSPDRAQESAGESLASTRRAAARTGGVQPLTSAAVLALQSTNASDPDANQSKGAQEASSDDADGTENSSKATANPNGLGATPAPAQGIGGALAQQQSSSKKEDPDGDGLNEAQEKQVQELAKRDREVRAHEQAHARVGGAYASAPSYTFQQGPDGKRYAVGGEVQIDTAKERTPEATIRKMQIVIRAALAPAEPSSQDLKVAQQARSQLSEAQAESRQQKAEELRGDEDTPVDPAATDTEPGQGQTDAGGENTDKRDADGSQRSGGDTNNDAQTGGRSASEEAAAAYRSLIEQNNNSQRLIEALIA
ncbi:putative metalloprotease CJM1_0395 family protein [uncultured Roseibium sp.]|uniref:putative metalloprotease CJM1_0395 family protein n=1 Tax=uncultured Roseibium sp. TaxID=1936171 RepID=UPI00260D4DC5|nr:putative metalloprotease CJM1_0395 family protein [uncultured Roseibium sp.]